MNLIKTLKWLWDPRTEEEKAYDAWNAATPLRLHTQTVMVYIKNTEKPFVRVLEFKEFEFGSMGKWRVNLDERVADWIAFRFTNGIGINSVWYAPNQIERIELGEKTVEPI
jgi:hypothetical protein